MPPSAPTSILPPSVLSRLAAVRRLFVLTGAGISAESGIPTFRSPGGLWNRFNPAELATPEAFDRDPALVWRWYLDRLHAMRQAQPNPAHRALAELQRRIPAVLIATQNIDGLHQRAGARDVVEIHGSIHRCRPVGFAPEHGDIPLDSIAIDPDRLPPIDHSGRILRPSVVWFGESLPEAPIRHIESFLADPPDLTLIIGTSSAFAYIADWACRGQRAGGVSIEINPERTELTPHVDWAIHQPAVQAMTDLLPRIGMKNDQ